MSHDIAMPVKAKFFTKGTKVVFGIMVAGMLAYAYRLLFGIGAATNLDDQWPWGIWIAIDVASGVALAAGGFTTAALADIFHKDKFHVITRPALITAMLGYTFVVIGLLADLGRYYNVWHPMLPPMWQGNSVLFEVGMCVMVYLTVLYVEFMPILVERFKGKVNLPGMLAKLNGASERLLKLPASVVAGNSDGDRADQDAPALVHADITPAFPALRDSGRLPDGDIRIGAGLPVI